MTAETCLAYYKQAEANGNEKAMKFWKERAKLHGFEIEKPKSKEEAKPKEEAKSKSKK